MLTPKRPRRKPVLIGGCRLLVAHVLMTDVQNARSTPTAGSADPIHVRMN